MYYKMDREKTEQILDYMHKNISFAGLSKTKWYYTDDNSTPKFCELYTNALADEELRYLLEHFIVSILSPPHNITTDDKETQEIVSIYGEPLSDLLQIQLSDPNDPDDDLEDLNDE
jgi:hypothetical protein